MKPQRSKDFGELQTFRRRGAFSSMTLCSMSFIYFELEQNWSCTFLRDLLEINALAKACFFSEEKQKQRNRRFLLRMKAHLYIL